MTRFLQDVIEIPQRPEKPRERGLSMVIDHGWSNARSEFVANTIPYIDIVKSTVPCILLDERIVRKNIETYRNLGIDVQMAGVIFEIAVLQGKQKELYKKIKEFGVNVVEVESHAANIDLGEKKSEIKILKNMGFKVVGEVGTKWLHADRTRRTLGSIYVDKVIENLSQLLDAGANYVYWEGTVVRGLIGNRLENQAGQAQLMEVVKAIGKDKIIFEVYSVRGNANTPLYAWLVHRLGPDINVGNLFLTDILYLEQVRRGITYDPDHPYLRWLSQSKPTPNWWEIELPDYSVDMEPPK